MLGGFVDDPASGTRDVVAASREANTAVYFIDLRGLAARPGGGSAADAEAKTDPADRTALAFQETVLESAGTQALADETGGFSVRNTGRELRFDEMLTPTGSSRRRGRNRARGPPWRCIASSPPRAGSIASSRCSGRPAATAGALPA